MNVSFHLDERRHPVRMRWFLAAGWVLIFAKCVAVSWAVTHWRVPVHATWLIAPTLAFAALATGVWLWADEQT